MTRRLIAGFALITLGVWLESSAAGRGEERPLWISDPKQSDGMYLYVVGSASGRDSSDDAQEAALQNARLKLSNKLRGEARCSISTTPRPSDRNTSPWKAKSRASTS